MIRKRSLVTAAALGAAYLWYCREACRGEHRHSYMSTIARQEDPLFNLTGPPVSRQDRRRRASEDACRTHRMSENEAVLSYFDEV